MGVTGIPRVLLYEGSAIHRLIKSEIVTLHEQQQSLKQQGRIGTFTAVILFLSIAVNILVFFTVGEYIALFIAASFYLYMIYFITLLMPIGRGTFRFPREQIHQFFSTLYQTGIIQTTDRITRIFLDAFFVNSRALCPGFVLVFSMDLIFALAGYLTGLFSLHALFVILFQVFAILLFYFLLWRLEPGSTQFREGIRDIRGAFTGRRYPSWVITMFFIAAALLLLFVIISTIILLPGMTVQAFLTLAGLESYENFFFFIGLLLVTQYFIVRFFHGMASTAMAARFSEVRIAALMSFQGNQEMEVRNKSSVGEPADDNLSPEQMRDAASVLLESRVYRLDYQTLWGAFPVYVVNLDFSVVFDEHVMKAITGYLKGAGLAGMNEEQQSSL